MARRSSVVAAGFVHRPGVLAGVFGGGLGVKPRRRFGSAASTVLNLFVPAAGRRAQSKWPLAERSTFDIGFCAATIGCGVGGEVADRGVEYGACGF